MAAVTGFEPATFCVTGRYSSLLNYTAKYWHRIKDLNLDCLSQSQACCRYTNPVYGDPCGI